MEQDMHLFQKLVETGNLFTVGEHTFHISPEISGGKFKYQVLALYVDDWKTTNEDGTETVASMTVASIRAFHSHDWIRLYAKVRTFIYLNFFENESTQK